MNANKAYKYGLYPNNDQEKYFIEIYGHMKYDICIQSNIKLKENY
ncbi:helix-turn-helix domain-containing protein [Borrelia persica]